MLDPINICIFTDIMPTYKINISSNCLSTSILYIQKQRTELGKIGDISKSKPWLPELQ